jgi:hypothetical protein
MDNICPFHQFEIRFSPILNFSSHSKEILAPYMQRASSFQVETENTINEKISLNFEQDSYSIVLWWDRLIFRTTVGIDNLITSNSIVDEPFLQIFKKLKEISSFGKVVSVLFYTLSVNVKNVESVAESTKLLVDKYLKRNELECVLPGFNDIAVVWERKDTKGETNITCGPYQGVADFNKRNVFVTQKNIELLSDVGGTMVEYKALSLDIKEIDLIFYKSELKNFLSIIEKL